MGKNFATSRASSRYEDRAMPCLSSYAIRFLLNLKSVISNEQVLCDRHLCCLKVVILFAVWLWLQLIVQWEEKIWTLKIRQNLSNTRLVFCLSAVGPEFPEVNNIQYPCSDLSW